MRNFFVLAWLNHFYVLSAKLRLNPTSTFPCPGCEIIISLLRIYKKGM